MGYTNGKRSATCTLDVEFRRERLKINEIRTLTKGTNHIDDTKGGAKRTLPSFSVWSILR